MSCVHQFVLMRVMWTEMMSLLPVEPVNGPMSMLQIECNKMNLLQTGNGNCGSREVAASTSDGNSPTTLSSLE